MVLLWLGIEPQTKADLENLGRGVQPLMAFPRTLPLILRASVPEPLD